MSPTRPRRARAAALALGCALALGACNQNETMGRLGRLKPLEALDREGPAVPAWRPAVPGTVARGSLRTARLEQAGDDGRARRLPVPLTRALLERGRERFVIYCAPCHSLNGDGDGLIVRRGFPAPPSLHIDRLRQAPVGHVFQVATEGVGAMPGYAAQIPAADRWAIAAYVRTLQLSRQAAVDALPPDIRRQLPGGAR